MAGNGVDSFFFCIKNKSLSFWVLLMFAEEIKGAVRLCPGCERLNQSLMKDRVHG